MRQHILKLLTIKRFSNGFKIAIYKNKTTHKSIIRKYRMMWVHKILQECRRGRDLQTTCAISAYHH
jgi:hypothetical protein